MKKITAVEVEVAAGEQWLHSADLWTKHQRPVCGGARGAGGNEWEWNVLADWLKLWVRIVSQFSHLITYLFKLSRLNKIYFRILWHFRFSLFLSPELRFVLTTQHIHTHTHTHSFRLFWKRVDRHAMKSNYYAKSGTSVFVCVWVCYFYFGQYLGFVLILVFWFLYENVNIGNVHR